MGILMQDGRPVPLRGQKWRHFKGTDVEITMITSPLPVEGETYSVNLGSITHTETLELVHFEWDLNRKVWLYGTGQQVYLDSHVIYKHPNEYGLVEYWARPLDNFLATLSNGNPVKPRQGGRGSTMYYRFTLLPEGTQ